MSITAKTKICMVVGYPIDHSLSPAMHNAAYTALGLDGEFIYLGANVEEDATEEMIDGMRTLSIRGYACTMPHKVEVAKYLDEVDPTAQKIGAVNTVVNNKGVLKGYNTDYLGVITPLKRLTDLKGKKVALIGAGGAARAIAFGLTQEGAVISTVFNRTRERAVALIESLGLDAEVKDFDEIGQIGDVDIIANATPIGMKGDTENETAVPKELIKPHHIVFDVVYSLERTRLLREAKEQGAKVVSGIEMVLYQAIEQLALHTGKELTKEDREIVEQAMKGALQKAGVIVS